MAHRWNGELLGSVELSSECDTRTLDRLVTAAFQASRLGPIVLLVDSSTRIMANKTLDRAVTELGTGVCGVLFSSFVEEPEVAMSQAARGSFVVAWSEQLQRMLRAHGVPFHPDRVGLRMLEAIAAGEPLPESRPTSKHSGAFGPYTMAAT